MRFLPVAIAIALSHPARADDEPKLKICQVPLEEAPAPGCRMLDSVKTRWGKVELYGAYDTRSEPFSPEVIKRGEYLAVYSLSLAGREQPETFEVGSQPTGHPYEQCGASDTHWCGRITSSTPRLSLDKKNVLTLVVKTITRDQHWVDVPPDKHRVEVTTTTRVYALRCVHDAKTGWECNEQPGLQ